MSAASNRRARAGVVAALVALSLLGTANAGVTWHEGTLDSAIEAAKAGNKLVLLDCWARWCTFCFVMDDKVWSQESLARALDREVVAVKAEVDAARRIGISIADRYQVEGLPLVLVIDPQTGRALRRLEGYHEAPAILEAVDQARRELDLDRDLAARTEDPAALVTLGTRHLRAGDAERAEPLFVRAAELDPDCTLDQRDDAALGLAEIRVARGDAPGAEQLLGKTAETCGGASGEREIWQRREDAARVIGLDALRIVLAARAARFSDDAPAAAAWALFLVEHEPTTPGALEACRRAVALAPESAEPQGILARAHLARGELDAAAEAVARAVTLDPHDRSLRELRLRIDLARRSR